jgi:uncharacterized repeat protein (TIGR01451 family)
MRRIVFLLSGFLLIIGLFTFASISSLPVQADSLLQEAPRLEGYQVYFTEENGEASRFDRGETGISRLAGLLRDLGAELKTLEWRIGIPQDADLIIMAGPNTDLNPDQVARLWAYLSDGGHLLLLTNPVTGTGRSRLSMPANSGLFNLLWADMGLRVRDDYVVIEGALQAEINNLAVANPPTLVTDFTTTLMGDEHPTTQGITGALAFAGARSLEIDASDRAVEVVPLFFSPDGFYGEVAFNDFIATGAAAYNIGQDTARAPQLLAAAAASPETQARVILVGDREFATNGVGLQSSPPNTGAFLHPDNARFLLKAVAWLLGADLASLADVAFPTPGATATPTLTPTPVIYTADLKLTMSVNDATPDETNAVVFNITVTNNGPDIASNVIVNYSVPAGLTYLLYSVNTRSGYDPTTGDWIVGNLNSGSSATMFVVVSADTATGGLTLSNTATVVMDSVDPNVGDNTATVDITVNRVASFVVPNITS